MKIFLVSTIIKNLIINDSNFNPFDDDFNAEELYRIALIELDKFRKDFQNVEFEGDILQCVQVLVTIAELYDNLLFKIEELLDEISLPDDDVINLILKNANFQTLSISDKIRATYTNGLSSKKITAHIKYDNSIKEQNVFGHEIALNDAADMIVDSTSELINIVKDYNKFDRKRRKVHKSDSEYQTNTTRLLILSNLICVLKETLNGFIYEDYDISLVENKINFLIKYDNFQLLKYAGKARFENHIMEMYIGFHSDAKFKIPKFNIVNNSITIDITQNEEVNHNLKISLSTLLTYFFYIQSFKIKTLDGITVQDLFYVLSNLRASFQAIDAHNIIDATEKNQDLAMIPMRITKKNLVSYLHKNTTLKKETIIKILNCISYQGKYLDLWRTPIIPFQNYYSFEVTSLSRGHISYLADSILSKCITQDRRLKMFKNYVINELDKQDERFTFEREEIESAPASVLVYKLKKTTLILSLFLFDFPINSKEFHTAVQKAELAADNLSSFKKGSEYSSQSTVNILLTNYPSISGMIIDSYHVMDITLLLNYIKTGEYKRGKLIGNKEQRVESKGIVSYRYYTNEEEFNNNFRKFCFEPSPIWEYLNLLGQKKIQIAEGLLDLEIYRDVISDISEGTIIANYIREVDYYLSQLFYFDNEMNKDEEQSKKEFLESRLAFLIPQLFSVAAFNSTHRMARLDVIDIFKKYRSIGISHLLSTVHNFLHNLSLRVGEKKDKNNNLQFNPEQAEEDLKNLLESLPSGAQLNFNKIELNHNLPEERVKNIIELLLCAIGSFQATHQSYDAIENQLFYTLIFAALVKGKEEYREDLIKAFTNFIDVLNYNSLYQKARDFAEDVLIYVFENDKTPIIGWICLLKCYTRQGDIFEAFGYANLTLAILDTLPEIEEFIVFDAMYNLMLLCRELGYEEMYDVVFNFLKKLSLTKYDSQKIHLSYYNGILNRGLNTINASLSLFDNYLDENIDDIIEYGQHATYPWVVFLLNIKNLIDKNLIDQHSGLLNKLDSLSQTIDPGAYQKITAQIFIDKEITAGLFTDSLERTFQTRSFENLMYEIGNLKPLAKHTALLSLEKEDHRLLLLTGLVLNNQRLVFEEIVVNGAFTQFNDYSKSDLLKNINNYKDYILSNLHLNKGQIVCWLFELEHTCYAFLIDNEKNTKVTKLNWDVNKMQKWLGKLDAFYFPDDTDYTINVQEDDYIKIHKEISQFVLNFDSSCNELLLCSSISLAIFPFNLLSTKSDPIIDQNLITHEERVGDYILQVHSDFLSYHIPITNIISLEWYIKNGNDEVINCNNHITTEGWCPVIDEDMTLLLAYEKLRPVIESKYNGIIHTGRIPERTMNSSVNFFLAHGGKGDDGFKTVYTRENEGTAIKTENGIIRLFGKGDIAVLFICNSAYISQTLFAESLVSFVGDILKLGYQTVVAPAWSLHPFIAPIWADSFLSELKTGKYVGQAAHIANLSVSKLGYDDYSGYYSPTGWASMHVYGNPNVRFVEV